MKRCTSFLFLFSTIVVGPAWAVNTAGLVIRNSTGEVITRCVEFEEESLPLTEILQRSGFPKVLSETEQGTFICYLHNDGQTDPTQCPGDPDGPTWNLYRRIGDGWELLHTPISAVTAVHGDVFGFVYGPPSTGTLPPNRTFADVCEIVSHAAVVIDHSDGRRVVRVVPFHGETITGIQLLFRSGLDVVWRDFGWGIAICGIDGEGYPSDTCFGDWDDPFWNFSILNSEGVFESSMVGAADTIVREQDVHGYLFAVWGVSQPPISRVEVFRQTSDVSFFNAYVR